jgi:hypothetical protein
MSSDTHGFAEDFSLKPNSVLQTFSKAQALEWVARWRDVYASEKRASGLSRFLWHTFSEGMYPSVAGQAAETLYQEHHFSHVIILSNDRKTAFLSAELPVCKYVWDFYVFPPDLAWTMAFTHEDGWLGPYFAKHPNYEALVQKAKQQRQVADRKAQELQRAKQQGWA